MTTPRDDTWKSGRRTAPVRERKQKPRSGQETEAERETRLLLDQIKRGLGAKGGKSTQFAQAFERARYLRMHHLAGLAYAHYISIPTVDKNGDPSSRLISQKNKTLALLGQFVPAMHADLDDAPDGVTVGIDYGTETGTEHDPPDEPVFADDVDAALEKARRADWE